MARTFRTDIEKEIIRVLERNSYLIKDDVVEQVFKILQRTKPSGRSTIIRYLDRLRSKGIIEDLDDSDFKSFGIKIEDKRNTYLALPETKKYHLHCQAVLEALGSKNSKERENALIEIESLRTVKFNSNQLNILVELLSNPEHKVYEKVARILHYNFDKLKFPDDLENFQKKMIELLEKNKKLDKNTKYHLIWMLGIMNNPKVIEFLKADVKKGYDYDLMRDSGYKFWSVANIVISHQTELFKFQKTLSDSQSKVMFNVRDSAQNNLKKYHRKIIAYEDILGRLKK